MALPGVPWTLAGRYRIRPDRLQVSLLSTPSQLSAGSTFCLQVKGLPLDLSNPESLAKTLAGAPDITHIFFCAYQSTGSFAKDVDANFSMFKGLVEAVEQACNEIKHVSFVSGTKWYGK